MNSRHSNIERLEYIGNLVKVYRPTFEFGEQGPARVSWSATTMQLTPSEIEIFAQKLLTAAEEIRKLNLSVGLEEEPEHLYN